MEPGLRRGVGTVPAERGRSASEGMCKRIRRFTPARALAVRRRGARGREGSTFFFTIPAVRPFEGSHSCIGALPAHPVAATVCFMFLAALRNVSRLALKREWGLVGEASSFG